MIQTWTTPAGAYNPLYADFLEQSHLLIAGATGSGKSCIINGIITTALLDAPVTRQFILIDPKRTELHQYKRLPHTLLYAADPENITPALQYAMDLINRRFERMQQTGDTIYNGSHVYIIIDELMYLMTMQRKTAQPLLQRILCIARAARVHVIAATQSPIAKIIPTELKCNFDSRIALRTATRQDSRNILDISGAETLPNPVIEHIAHCIYRSGTTINKYIVPPPDPETMHARINYWTQQQPRTAATPTPAKRRRGLFALFA